MVEPQIPSRIPRFGEGVGTARHEERGKCNVVPSPTFPLPWRFSVQISRDRFLGELKRFGLKLESHLLDFFLKRLNVDLSLTNGMVPYREVINAFKEQSDPTKKRINADNPMLRVSSSSPVTTTVDFLRLE